MDEEKKYWLRFSAFPGIGPLRFKLLRKFFGTAKRAWYANEKVLREIGLGDRKIFNGRLHKFVSLLVYCEWQHLRN